MTIYVFGNPDHQQDSIALTTMRHLQSVYPQIQFIVVKPNQDLPFENQPHVIIMDAVKGINKVTRIEDHHLEQILMPPRGTAHDFGLGFQLKYLKKLGRLGTVTIIGLPLSGKFELEDVNRLIYDIIISNPTSQSTQSPRSW